MAKESKLFEKVAIKLAPADLIRVGKVMAEKEAAKTKLEEEKADALKTYNDKIHTLEAEISDCARQIIDGQSETDIEVVEEPDDGRKVMIIKEAESGRMLRTRKMTLEEIGDSEIRLNGEPHDTEPPEGEAKPKGRRKKNAAAEATEDAAE